MSHWYAPRRGETRFGHQLKRAGYRTALVGKLHFTPWQDCFGFDVRNIAEAKVDDQGPDDYERFLNKHGLSRRDLHDLSGDAYIQRYDAPVLLLRLYFLYTISIRICCDCD